MHIIAMLGMNTQKYIAVFLGFMVITIIWFIEKTKVIPQYGEVFYEMGLQCKDECGPNKQLKYFEKANHHKPNVNGVWYRLGLIYEEMGDDAKALESFITAAEFDQSDMLAYYKAGRHYLEKGAYEQALRYFLRVYTGSGYPDDVRYYLAMTYDQMKEYDLAIEFYNRIVLMHEEFADKAYPRLAQIYCSLNREDVAISQAYRLRTQYRYELADQLEHALKAAQVSKNFTDR